MGQIIYSASGGSGVNDMVVENSTMPLEVFRFNFGAYRSVVDPTLGLLGPNKQSRITFVGQFSQNTGSNQTAAVKIWAGEINETLLVELPVVVPDGNGSGCFCKFICTIFQRFSGEMVLISEIYRGVSGGDSYNFIRPLPNDIFEYIESPLIVTVSLGAADSNFVFSALDVYAEYL